MSNLKMVADSLLNTLTEAVGDIQALNSDHSMDEKLIDYATLLRIARNLVDKAT